MTGWQGDKMMDQASLVRFPSIEILGVRVHRVNFAQTLEQIARWIAEDRNTQYAIRNSLPEPHLTPLASPIKSAPSTRNS